MKNLALLLLIIFYSVSCSVEENNDDNAWNSDNTVVTNNFTPVQRIDFLLKGNIWSPGADDPFVLKSNKFPIPGALVIAYTYMPDPPPENRFYCNECVEIPRTVKYTKTDFDGSFELSLTPNSDYFIVIQKGLFRRVTYFRSGNIGEMLDLEPVNMFDKKSSIVTLPNNHSPEDGLWIPRILLIVGRGEEFMNVTYEALGFIRDVDFEEITDTEAQYIASDVEQLKKYNIIIATCGDEAKYLSTTPVREALREYVKLGGKLFIDDFAYDWAEQPFPEFMSFKVEHAIDYEEGSCGEGAMGPSEVGKCVNYSCYDSVAYTEDPYLQGWLDVIDDHTTFRMEYGCNILHNLGKGVQGTCSDPEDPTCIDGLIVDYPKVWVRGSWTEHEDLPLTISWDYYCGKVLYTVLHTHTGDSNVNAYELLLQEKMMVNLLLEIQTCVVPSVVQ
jgi:hypothetical protein